MMQKRIDLSQSDVVMYGPWSQTFRMYRLENLMMMSMSVDSRAQCKFYGWECFSLKMPERTVDFVVKDSQVIIPLVITLKLMIN